MDIRVSGHQIDTGAALQTHVEDRMQGIVDNRPLGCSLVEQAKRAVPWSAQSAVTRAHRDDGLKGGDVEREVVAHQQHDGVAIGFERGDGIGR